MNAASSPSSRIPALDFTKGLLVLIMVLYHWLNYFVSTEGGFYTYLRFLTPSFIFITGFLISHVYLAGSRIADPRLPKRLFVRGMKILGVFIVLNLARAFVIRDARVGMLHSQLWDASSLLAVFVTGNVAAADTGKITSFNILVPISYLLLLSSLLVKAARRMQYVFHAVLTCAILLIVILGANGVQLGNLELIAIGLFGVVAGYMPIERVNVLVSNWYLLIVAYLCYLGVISIYGATFPLQVVGVCICVMVIYRLGLVDEAGRSIRGHVELLGRYSLFAYIGQIAILQVLYRAMRSNGLSVVEMVISFVAAFVLTSLVVVAMDRVRPRVRLVDRLYRAVFA